jgi:hypothetical protein
MSSSLRDEFAPHTHALGRRCFKLSFIVRDVFEKTKHVCI